MLAGGAGALSARAVSAGIGAVSALAHSVVACGAGAGLASAGCADVVAVATFADVAFIVVAVVLTVGVAIVQVVNVIQVDNCLVAALGAVGVGVGLGFAVQGCGAHGLLLGVLVHIVDDVANMFVCKGVEDLATLLPASDDLCLPQHLEVVRCQRLRYPHAGVNLTDGVRFLHDVPGNRQAERVRKGGEENDRWL